MFNAVVPYMRVFSRLNILCLVTVMIMHFKPPSLIWVIHRTAVAGLTSLAVNVVETDSEVSPLHFELASCNFKAILLPDIQTRSSMTTFSLYLVFFASVVSFPVLHAHAHPIQDWMFTISPGIQSSERNWWWNWWGIDSSVSIVDRSPPLTFLARPASFGQDLDSPLLGYVIPLDSFTKPCSNHSFISSSASPIIDTPLNIGCPSVCLDGPHEPDPEEPWIALVQRGGCQFVEKAREAQRLGAKAVVVGGDNPDIYGNPDTLVNMYSPGVPVSRIIRISGLFYQ